MLSNYFYYGIIYYCIKKPIYSMCKLDPKDFHHFSCNYSIALYQKEDCHASEMGD